MAPLLLTAHTLSPEARGVITSMVLQALLRPDLASSTESSLKSIGLLDCAVTAFLLSLLHYLVVQASQPPAHVLIHEVDALLKVSPLFL